MRGRLYICHLVKTANKTCIPFYTANIVLSTAILLDVQHGNTKQLDPLLRGRPYSRHLVYSFTCSWYCSTILRGRPYILHPPFWPTSQEAVQPDTLLRDCHLFRHFVTGSRPTRNIIEKLSPLPLFFNWQLPNKTHCWEIVISSAIL